MYLSNWHLHTNIIVTCINIKRYRGNVRVVRTIKLWWKMLVRTMEWIHVTECQIGKHSHTDMERGRQFYWSLAVAWSVSTRVIPRADKPLLQAAVKRDQLIHRSWNQYWINPLYLQVSPFLSFYIFSMLSQLTFPLAYWFWIIIPFDRFLLINFDRFMYTVIYSKLTWPVFIDFYLWRGYIHWFTSCSFKRRIIHSWCIHH